MVPRGSTTPKSIVVQPGPGLGLKPMVNLYFSSILIRGSPL